MSPISPRGAVRVKAGVQFTVISPAGFRMLGAIERAARALAIELVITSACDGDHSGPGDPHHDGEAYDLRTRALTDIQKDTLCFEIIRGCSDDVPALPLPIYGVPRSQASSTFFAFVEAAGTPNEHIHVQLRKGRNYP